MAKGTLAQDMNCIDHFAGLMKDRMAYKAPEKGDEWRRNCTGEMWEAAYEALVSKKFVDLANYCMMLHARLSRESLATEALTD